MNRNVSTNAIVLSVSPSKENNSTVTLLTEKEGVIYATLYGGHKSRLKSLFTLWNSGIVYLYKNEERKSIKINDFDVKKYHSSFSENLFKMWSASLASEIILKTKCGGSNNESWILLNGFLDGLEISNEDQSKLGLIRFLWRYLSLLGIQPDATFCGKCGKSFFDIKNHKMLYNETSYFDSIENCFICTECSYKDNRLLPVKTDGVEYLAAISLLTPAEVRKLQIDKNVYGQIKDIVYYLIENGIGTKLNSLETGIGIL